MTDQKLIFKHLTKRVILDKDTITYRLLARELGLIIQDAKSSMNEFIKDESILQRGGFSPTWLISGLLLPSPPLTTTTSIKSKNVNENEMEIDSEELITSSSQIELDPSQLTQGNDNDEEELEGEKEVISKRGNILVADCDLASQMSLFQPNPSIQIYSLSPGPLNSLILLTAYKISNLNSDKWKLPSIGGSSQSVLEVGGGVGNYGGIIHPDGEGRKIKKLDLKGKGKATTSTTTTKKVIPVEDKKPTIVEGKGKGKEIIPTKPSMRPIGSLGGLFAKFESAPVVVPVVNKKRKSSPPPPLFKKASISSNSTVVKKAVTVVAAKKVEVKKKKTKIISNGIWGDAEVTDDGESEEEQVTVAVVKTKVKKEIVSENEDEEAEAALREEEKKEKDAIKRKEAEKKKKKELIEKGKSGKVETAIEKQKREVEIMMMSDDDDMEVDVPAPKASTSKATTSKPVEPKKKVVEQPQKNMKAFFGKK